MLGALSGGVAAIVRVSHGVEQTETALGNYLKCLYCVTIHAVMGRSVGKKSALKGETVPDSLPATPKCLWRGERVLALESW